MNNRFSQRKQRPGSSRQHPLIPRRAASVLKPSLGKGVGVVIVLAFGSGALLLAYDLSWPIFTPLAHAPISALPLLLIGLAALGFQFVIRPNLLALFKACIVSTAFLLWGIDQLLPAGWLATTIGDIVIVLFVIDLGWMMADRLKQQGLSQRASQAMAPSSLLAPDQSSGSTESIHILPPPPFLPLPEQSTRSASTLKRQRLLPLQKPPQECQP